MTTILVLAGGSETDEAVFETAFAAAVSLATHLECLYVRLGPGERRRQAHLWKATGTPTSPSRA